MEDYVKRLEGVYRNIQNGGYFEETRTIDGGEKGSYNPTIPKGFRPVDTDTSSWGDGTKAPDKEDVDNGLVIEDKEGNQFVWVPCSTNGQDSATGETVTTYAKHEYTGNHTDVNDSGAGVNTQGNDGWMTWFYGKYNDWKDPAVDTDISDYIGDQGYGTKSVSTYGGFYVARYEAGIPETVSFYNDAVKTSYKPQWDKGLKAGENRDIRNVGTIAPVSKKNTPSWSWISQENAISASEKMLEGKSHLIDGTAWDTIVNWIGDTTKTVTDSKDVGNYYTSTGKISTGTMYIQHKYENGWTTGEKYQKVTADIEQPKGTGTARYEVYTGSLENTKLKNIYDMAGNMFEWTTETGKHGKEDDGSYAVLRGGSFSDNATDKPLCKRDGYNTVTYTHIDVGFRVVLYL